MTVDHVIDPADGLAFAAAIAVLGETRRRDGACYWQVLTDAADPRRRVEAFMQASWLEHLRQHERVTVEDRLIQERVRAFHRGPHEPLVSHLLATPLPPGAALRAPSLP